jgi:hypothetical protein
MLLFFRPRKAMPDSARAVVLAGAARWRAEGSYTDADESMSTKRIDGECHIEAVTARNIGTKSRAVATSTCTTVLPDGAKAITSTDFAEALGEIGSRAEIFGADGKSQGVVRWKLHEVRGAK